MSQIYAKPKKCHRVKTLRTKYETVIPLDRLKEPYYGDLNIRHNVLCGLNKHTQTTTLEMKPAIWTSTYPLPVFDGVLAHNDVDKVLQLAKQKNKFISNLNRLKLRYRHDKTKFESAKRQFRKENNTNLWLIKAFAEYLETDPDKYFNGSYNWYFTGGNMEIVYVNDHEYLIHAEGSELEKLKISKPNFHDGLTINTTDIYDTKLRSLDKEKTIYEIKSVVNEPYFTVRQKHTLSVLHLSSDTLKLRKIHSDIPLVTSAVNSSMKLILIDAKQHLQLFNLIDEKPLSQANIFGNEMTIDNWSSVRFIEDNQFLCANRKKMSIFDVRQTLQKPVICHDFADSTGHCEDISCVEQSNNNTFIAFTHRLLALDMRNYKDGKMPTLSWVHQLKTAPIMLDIIKMDNTSDLIAIGGVKSGDVKICDTTTLGDITISNHLPYAPLSVHGLLKYAKCHGKFLDPNSCIQPQIRQSNTGIKLKKLNSNKYSLLTTNACGDIFAQEIIRRSACNEILEPNFAKMDIWKKKREHRINLEATDVTNFESLAAFLSFNMHNEPMKRDNEPVDAQNQPWQLSVEELASYKDVLANSLLDKWVVSDDVDMDEKYTDQRMHDWVDSTVEQYQVEVFQEDICVKSEPEIQEY